MNQKTKKQMANAVGATCGRPNFVGKTQKGITLIALVITIIVLLILAGVTISMVLGDDGIISNAQQAKKQNEDASLKDAISVAKADAATYKYVEQTPVALNNLGDIKTRIEAYNTANPTATYTYENTVAKIVEGVPIPIGFAYVQGTKVDTGLIVVDGYGNEYVWVPVDEVLASGTANYEDDKVSLIHEEEDIYLNSRQETYPGMDADAFALEYENMKQSVSLYGGFYVGRYETSWTGSRVASIGNAEVMDGKTPIEMIQSEFEGEFDTLGTSWYTFYNKLKDLHANSDGVVSGMISGSQWDAIVDWMSDIPNPNALEGESNLFIKNAIGMGHYCFKDCILCDDGFMGDDGEEECWDCGVAGEYQIVDPVEPIKTGSNMNYCVKNIFDLAGNYKELTRENYQGTRMWRGGGYDLSLANINSLEQWHDECSYPQFGHEDETARIQLYIK